MARIADPTRRRWTYEEYARLTEEGEAFEIIDGEAFVNADPSSWHQRASFVLQFRLELFLQGKNIGGMLPPVDVVFADATVLQPDIAVVLREHASRVRKAGIFGAPDFVVEVLSPSTRSRDRREKMAVYAKHGVREYWLADPEKRTIEVFVLEAGKLVRKAMHEGGEARSLAVLPGFSAALAEVFQRPGSR